MPGNVHDLDCLLDVRLLLHQLLQLPFGDVQSIITDARLCQLVIELHNMVWLDLRHFHVPQSGDDPFIDSGLIDL